MDKRENSDLRTTKNTTGPKKLTWLPQTAMADSVGVMDGRLPTGTTIHLRQRKSHMETPEFPKT